MLTQSDPIEALREAGFACAFFHLSGFSPSGEETLMIDDGMGGGAIPMGEWLVHPGVDFAFSDIAPSVSSLTGSAIVTAFVTVPAFGIDEFSVITDAFGAAGHIPVPEPTALLSFGLGILGVAGYRRRYHKN